jgi:hypothetical protein
VLARGAIRSWHLARSICTRRLCDQAQVPLRRVPDRDVRSRRLRLTSWDTSSLCASCCMCRWLHRCIWHVGLGHRGIGRPQLKLVIQKASKRPFSQRGMQAEAWVLALSRALVPTLSLRVHAGGGSLHLLGTRTWSCSSRYWSSGSLLWGRSRRNTRDCASASLRTRQQTRHNARESAQEL